MGCVSQEKVELACVCVWEMGVDGERAASNEARGSHTDDVVPAKLVMEEPDYFSMVSCRLGLLGCQPLRKLGYDSWWFFMCVCLGLVVSLCVYLHRARDPILGEGLHPLCLAKSL